MHSVCLGITRKLLNTLIGGKLNVRLPSRLVIKFSEHLISLSKHIPVEINRKPRGLSELARWKATEFRTFLLYLSPIVFKDIVDLGIYEHFMLLHCGILILCSLKYIGNIGLDVSKQMLKTFVTHCEEIYGSDYLIYNVHSLIHISEDVKRFGTSGFPFENFLGKLKSLIKSPKNPLQQIYNRLIEANLNLNLISCKSENVKFKYEHSCGPFLHIQGTYKQYKKLIFPDFQLMIQSNYSEANSYCLLNDGRVAQLFNIIVADKQSFIIANFNYISGTRTFHMNSLQDYF